MDLILLAGIATALLVVLITLLLLNKSKAKNEGKLCNKKKAES